MTFTHQNKVLLTDQSFNSQGVKSNDEISVQISLRPESQIPRERDQLYLEAQRLIDLRELHAQIDQMRYEESPSDEFLPCPNTDTTPATEIADAPLPTTWKIDTEE